MQGADLALDLPSKKRVLGVAGQTLILCHFMQGVDAHGAQGADLGQTDSGPVLIGKGLPVERRSVVYSVMGGSSRMSVRVRQDYMRCLSSLCSRGGGGKFRLDSGSRGIEESSSIMRILQIRI